MSSRDLTRGALLLVLMLGSGAVEAQIKKCVDAQGKVTYTDRPCATNSQQSVVDIPVSTPAKPAVPPASSGARAARDAAPAPAARHDPRAEDPPCAGLANESCRHTHEECDAAFRNPTDANIASCARAAGYKVTRTWIQLSTDQPRKYQDYRHVSVKCIGIDGIDNSIVELGEANGRFSAKGGPSFESWEQGADKLCNLRSSARSNTAGSREDRLTGAGLVDAACGGRAAEVRSLLAKKVSTDSRSYEHDFTALHCAALRGDVGLIRDLKSSGAALDAVATDFGLQPIHAAAMSGKFEAVRELTRLGASINASSLAGSPVLVAFSTGSHNLLPNRLEKQLGDAVETAISRRYRESRVATLEEFVKLGAGLGGVNEKGEDLLMLAVQNRDLAMVKVMLARKANPNVRNAQGLPVLHQSLVTGRFDVSGGDLAIALLDAGADINSRDPKGATIQCRVFTNHDFLGALFARGLDPNTVDEEGGSCWWTMSRDYDAGAAPKLFDPLRNLRTPRRADGTPGAGPLFSCAAQNDLNCVNYLLKRGLKPIDVGPGRQTVMHAVARNSGGSGDHEGRRRAVTRALLAAGARLGEYDEYGETPLMAARIHEQAFIVFLIEQGADVNAVNQRSGKSVLDMYSEFRKEEVVAALKAKGARSAGGAQRVR